MPIRLQRCLANLHRSGLAGIAGLLFATLSWSSPSGAGGVAAAVIQVGPARTIASPAQAARIAQSGSIIEIDAGDYYGDVAVWRQNNLIIRAVGGRARIHADGRSAQGKAVWVITGSPVLIEGVELSGAQVADHNGAGIRYEGGDLTLRDCRLHHNEMGLLAGTHSNGRVLIDGCEIDHNLTDTAAHGKLGHNLYIGRIASFVLRGSYVHDGSQGHLVKSRAWSNRIVDNRLIDRDGSSSYLIDLPNGGQAQISGNLLVQGAGGANRTAIAFAAEHGRDAPGQYLRVFNNVFENDAVTGIWVRNFSATPAELEHNQLPLLTLRLVGRGGTMGR